MVNALSGSPVCPQCGAAVGGTAGRCIQCGFLFTEATPPISAPLGFVQGRMRPRPKPRQTGKLAALILLGGLLGVAAVSALAWSSLKRSAEERRLATEAAPASARLPPPAPSSTALEPDALLPSAKSKALAWHRDALLVEIDAAPVGKDGKLDGDGSVSFVFGKPASAKVGMGADVRGTAFQVSFGSSGSETREKPAPRARAVAEPNCLVEDVAKIIAASVPSAGPLRLRYAMSEKHERAVWRVYEVGADKVLRTLDGTSCNILSEK